MGERTLLGCQLRWHLPAFERRDAVAADSERSSPNPFIALGIFGGLARDVFCSVPDARIIHVDWDQDPEPAFKRDEIVRGKGGCSAFVGVFDARSLHDLADTDEATAVLGAQEKGVLDEAIFVVS